MFHKMFLGSIKKLFTETSYFPNNQILNSALDPVMQILNSALDPVMHESF